MRILNPDKASILIEMKLYISDIKRGTIRLIFELYSLSSGALYNLTSVHEVVTPPEIHLNLGPQMLNFITVL